MMDPSNIVTPLVNLFSIVQYHKANVEIKILKRLKNSFIVADSGCHCTLKIDPECSPPIEFFKEGKCLRIKAVGVSRDTNTIMLTNESSFNFCDPILDVEFQVCLNCHDVVCGDDGMLKHFRDYKQCKTKYDLGSGQFATIQEFFKVENCPDSLKVKIIGTLNENSFEAADSTGTCKVTIHPDHYQKDSLKIGKTISFMNPRCNNREEKILKIERSCLIEENTNMKVPIVIYNDGIVQKEKVIDFLLYSLKW